MDRNYQPVNIYCASCGAPARFDIARQVYTCSYCGSDTGIRESLQEKQGFQRLHRESLEKAAPEYPMTVRTCTGCGATVVFPEGEALSYCAFCGRSLTRREYLGAEAFPEILIPFRLTRDEAKERLLNWCGKNSNKPEADEVRAHIDELQGFYLPYTLVKGPTQCAVSRTSRVYSCRGFLDGGFINTSDRLDNLLLDGMEPYALEDLREFDFSYLAGQRVKICDLSGGQIESRIREEVKADYEPFLSKVMESRAVRIEPNTGDLLRLSAVLPAYYLRAGKTIAAVNGQTGKTAVQEIKERFLLPWQLFPLGWTVVICAVIAGVMRLFGAEWMTCAWVSAMMAVFFLIVLFTAYHNKYGGSKRKKLPQRIFTSDDRRPFVADPIFFERVDGQLQGVALRFTTPLRMLKMVAIAIGTVFLPLILAFLFNGCSTEGMAIGGAAVWLCITVPIAPVYLVHFGRLELYEHPLVRVLTPQGGGRWRRADRRSKEERARILKLFLSPKLLLVLLGVLGLLILNVYLILNWD